MKKEERKGKQEGEGRKGGKKEGMERKNKRHC